jgi:YhcH/YjgK/YiaL family protein
MITDKIENINLYTEIPEYAKEFIKTLSKEIELGRYNLKQNDFANIETYETKLLKNAKFETHNKFIDIQILLTGSEKIYIKNKKDLLETPEYNTEKDISFYTTAINNSDYITLNGTNFVMIYPHEAHAPQVAINECPNKVKKVVLKIKI